MSKIQIKFEKLNKVLKALEDIYKKIDQDRAYIDATIQRFEFTFELAWKLLKDYFAEKGIVLNYPKDILRQAYQAGLIENEELWLAMLHDRNMTSHTYDEKLADQIYANIRSYVPETRKLCDLIKTSL